MAFILLKSHQTKFVSAQQGSIIWRVYTGELKGSEKQRAFVKRIERIYLNRQNAPASYLAKNPPVHERPKQKALAGQIRLPYAE